MSDIVSMSIDKEVFNQMIWDMAKDMATNCAIDLLKIQTLTEQETAEKLHVPRQNVAMWRNIGMLVPIKVGKRYVYSPKELERFEDTYRGYEIGSREKAMIAYQEIKEKATGANSD